MPIEQIFVTTITARRATTPTPRAGVRRAGTIFGFRPDADIRQDRRMRILAPCGAAARRLDPDADSDPGRRVPAAAARAGRHRRCDDGADGRRRCRDREGAAQILRARPLGRRRSSATISGGWCGSISASPRSTASRWRRSSWSGCRRRILLMTAVAVVRLLLRPGVRRDRGARREPLAGHADLDAGPGLLRHARRSGSG